jgi:hypothetical protein
MQASTNDKPQEHNLAAIHQLLLAAFTAEDLLRFCLDRPTFRPVVASFGPKYSLQDMVDEVITYCDKRDLFGELLAQVRQVNPRQYARFEPALWSEESPPGLEAIPGAAATVNIQIGEVKMSDTFVMSGDFRGAILNIKSTLINVSQTVGALPHADESLKEELQRLIDQLNDQLQQVPPAQVEEAQAVAESAKELVETATQDKPNKVRVQITADGLKKAAQSLASVMPTVLVIADQIVHLIGRLTGTG